MQARAAVLESASGPFVVQDIELEDPRPDEVLVRVAGAGICHSDLLFHDGVMPFDGAFVLGHEGAGVVEKVGSGVRGIAPGDHVLMSYASCGRCTLCRRAKPQYCQDFNLLNVGGYRPDGSPTMTASKGSPLRAHWFAQSSFATHALTLERNLVVVPKDVPIESLGPLGCGVQTGAGAVLNAMSAEAGASLAVFGCGGVGMSAVMAANVAGCSEIVAVDVHKSRLDLAAELGATHVIDASASDDVVAAIREQLGHSVDYSLDTSGIAARSAVDVIGPGGIAVLVAAGMSELTLNGYEILFGKTVKGIFEGDATPQTFLPRLVDLHRQGRFPFEQMVSYYPLADINVAVHEMRSGSVIKPVLLPSSER